MNQTEFLDLSGTYAATGFDRHDGHFAKEVNLTLDKKNSDFQKGYAAYHYYSNLEDGTVLYRGSMLASGNQLSLGFSSATEQPDDDGIAIGVVSHDPDANGKSQIVLHFFYYQSRYRGGGHGAVVCVKK